jgi:hypothetical protein
MSTATELSKLLFEIKLAGEKPEADVVREVQTGQGDFVLLDARDRVSYDKGHIPGVLSAPLQHVDALAASPRAATGEGLFARLRRAWAMRDQDRLDAPAGDEDDSLSRETQH